MAALCKVVAIETKERAQFIAVIKPDSQCVSDCRFSSAGSTVKPEDGLSIGVWTTRPILDLGENLNAGAGETLLRGVITSAMCISQSIQLWIRSETHIGGEDDEKLPKLSGSSIIRISTESICVQLQLTTVVLIEVTMNILKDRVVQVNIMGVGEELRTCCRHSSELDSEKTMVSGQGSQSRNGSVTAVTTYSLPTLSVHLVHPSNIPYSRRRRFKGTSSDKNVNKEQKIFAVGGVPKLYKDGWEAADDEDEACGELSTHANSV